MCVCVDVLACSMPLPQRCAWYGEWFVGSCIFASSICIVVFYNSEAIAVEGCIAFCCSVLFCSLLNESVSFVCIATFGSMYFLLLKS